MSTLAHLRRLLEHTPVAEISTDDFGGNPCVARRARNILWQARVHGIVKPTACEHCGSDGRVEGHHTNYYRAIDVTWLCSRCHRAEHSRLYRMGIAIPGEPADRYVRFAARAA